MYNETSTDSSPLYHFPTSIIMAAVMLLISVVLPTESFIIPYPESHYDRRSKKKQQT
jgi:hypothetical protein